MTMRSPALHAALLALVGLALAAPPADAQARISVEPRVGVTFPLGDLNDADLEAGTVFGANLLLNVHPRFSAYLGLNRHDFRCDESCTALGSSPRSSGLGAGVKLILPSPADALVWARAGVIAHEYSDDIESSGRNAGWEAGAGFDMLLGRRLYLVPFMGYFQHDAVQGLSAQYLTFGVGVLYHIRQSEP